MLQQGGNPKGLDSTMTWFAGLCGVWACDAPAKLPASKIPKTFAVVIIQIRIAARFLYTYFMLSILRPEAQIDPKTANQINRLLIPTIICTICSSILVVYCFLRNDVPRWMTTLTMLASLVSSWFGGRVYKLRHSHPNA